MKSKLKVNTSPPSEKGIAADGSTFRFFRAGPKCPRVEIPVWLSTGEPVETKVDRWFTTNHTYELRQDPTRESLGTATIAIVAVDRRVQTDVLEVPKYSDVCSRRCAGIDTPPCNLDSRHRFYVPDPHPHKLRI